jgi:hypothetical protein
MKARRMIQFPSAAKRWFLAAVLVTTSPAVPAAFAGPCLRATVDEQVTLPDGSVHAPGEIRICVTRSYSPAADLNAISVGGEPLGLFVGRRKLSEDLPKGQDAVMVFERGAGAGLQLVAFGVRDRDRFEVRSFGPLPRNQAVAKNARGASADPGPSVAEATKPILVTASAQ